MHTKEVVPYEWRRAYSLPPSPSHHRHSGPDGQSGWADCLEAQEEPAGEPAETAGQERQHLRPCSRGQQGGGGQGGKAEAAGAEQEDLPPVHHKA